MFSRNTWIIIAIIVLVVVVYAYYQPEEFCSGMGNVSLKPTYFVYRPFGDVSNYGDDGQFASVGGSVPLKPMQDLGWKTGMPYDAFVSSLNMNSWAAGSDPDWKNHSSVPFLKMDDVAGRFRDANRQSQNGGYAQNYGTKCNGNDVTANSMVRLSKPDFDWQGFVTGPYRYPNMLSTGLPEVKGPAGEFVSLPCAEANAYNLGVGVL